MKMKKILAIVFIVAIFIGIYAWKFSDKKGVVPESGFGEAQKYSINLIMNLENDDLGLLNGIAHERGLYEKNNLSVREIFVEKDYTSALLAGAGDVVITGHFGAISAYLAGSETRSLADIFIQFSQHGVSRFSKEDAGKIRKVGVYTTQGDPIIMTRRALKRIGADAESVEFVSIPLLATRLDMLKKGDIDFTLLSSEKDASLARSTDSSWTFYEAKDLFKSIDSMRQIYTTKDVLEKKPEDLKAFVLSIFEALKYIDENPSEAKKYLVEQKGFTAEKADDIYSRYVASRKDVSFVTDPQVVEKIVTAMKNAAQKNNKAGNFDRDLKDYFYDDFAKNAIEKAE